MKAEKLSTIVDIIKFTLENSVDIMDIQNEHRGLVERLSINASKDGKPFLYYFTHSELEEMYDNNKLNRTLLEIREHIFKSTR